MEEGIRGINGHGKNTINKKEYSLKKKINV